MKSDLAEYAQAAGREVIEQLRKLARPLVGKLVVHVNSTRVGGGVAEILERLVPLMRELEIESRCEVIEGDSELFTVTKSFHNALQGDAVDVSKRLLEAYLETNVRNAATLRGVLADADFVFVHDPQPATLLSCFPRRKGKWIWRCHIDVSRPYRPVWKYLREFVRGHDASILSLAAFAQPLPHPQYFISPSIDPLSEKNILDRSEVDGTAAQLGLDPHRPVVLQVSRFDRRRHLGSLSTPASECPD